MPVVRRILLGTGLLLVAAALGACGGRKTVTSVPAGPSSTRAVLASDLYAARVGPDVQRAKLDRLEQAVTRLRTETGSSGWQARQDDVTGDAAELSGGIYQAGAGQSAVDVVRTFLQRHGQAFGLTG